MEASGDPLKVVEMLQHQAQFLDATPRALDLSTLSWLPPRTLGLPWLPGTVLNLVSQVEPAHSNCYWSNRLLETARWELSCYRRGPCNRMFWRLDDSLNVSDGRRA